MKVTLALLLACSAGMLQAASPAIGIAMTNGKFLLDHSMVVGNSSVFDGSVIETQKAMSDLSLDSGLKMRLGTESRGRIFRDRLVLEKGAGQVSGSTYVVEAGSLRVAPLDAGATARVAYGDARLVEVAAVTGTLRVKTAGGFTVANIPAGASLSFLPQAGAAPPTSLCGKVESTQGKYMLTDTTTKVTVDLSGADLGKYVGKSVAVTGNMSGNDSMQVLGVKESACGPAGSAGKAGKAAKVGRAGGGAAGKAAGVGMTTAAKVAIAGVVVGSATGASLGLAVAAGAFDDTPVSR